MSSRRYHLIIDLTEVPSERLVNEQGLAGFIKKLPDLIGMKIMHGPVVITGVPTNPGVTAFVIIDFSHISIHTFTETNEALIDIFSCKKFDHQIAVNYVLDYFMVEKSKAHIKQVIND